MRSPPARFTVQLATSFQSSYDVVSWEELKYGFEWDSNFVRCLIRLVDDFVDSWNTEVFVDHSIGNRPWGFDKMSE
jgi:hypothetical protein